MIAKTNGMKDFKMEWKTWGFILKKLLINSIPSKPKMAIALMKAVIFNKPAITKKKSEKYK